MKKGTKGYFLYDIKGMYICTHSIIIGKFKTCYRSYYIDSWIGSKI